MENKYSSIPTSIPTATSNSPLTSTPDPNLKPSTSVDSTPDPNLKSSTSVDSTPDPNLKSSTSVDSTPEQRALARDEKLAELKAEGYKGAELDSYMQSWFFDTEWYKELEATINDRFKMYVGDRFTEA